MARIAVVDDSKLIRTLVAAVLTKAGHQVLSIEPESLATTLGALLAGRPDLLILDHAMPAFQGPSLVRACFEHPNLAGLRVILLTAFHDPPLAERMRKLGVADLLHKPIRPEDLSAAVTRVLGDEGLR